MPKQNFIFFMISYIFVILVQKSIFRRGDVKMYVFATVNAPLLTTLPGNEKGYRGATFHIFFRFSYFLCDFGPKEYFPYG